MLSNFCGIGAFITKSIGCVGQREVISVEDEERNTRLSCDKNLLRYKYEKNTSLSSFILVSNVMSGEFEQ